jgi:type IV secretion system protein VirD4
MLDEFPRLGKIEAVITGLATLRSKKITIMPIIQSLAQLDATYGHEQRKIIADNCSWKAVLNATDADTQKYFSQLVGTEQRVKESRTRSGYDSAMMNILTDTKVSESVSTSTEEKAIIRPEEFAYLNKEVVLLTPYGYSRVQQLPYYQTEHLRQAQQQQAAAYNSW